MELRRAERVSNEELRRERVVARLKPAVRKKLRETATKWRISESRLIEMGLEHLLSEHGDESTLKSLTQGIEDLNITLRRVLKANESQSEVLGHFIFQYFTTAPMTRRSDEDAVRLTTRERFIDFLSRVKAGMEMGRSIFELGYGERQGAANNSREADSGER